LLPFCCLAINRLGEMLEHTESLLTTRDAARRLGVGPSTIKRWADEGLLECVRTAGGHRRFPRAQVEAMLQSSREPPREFVDHWVQLLCGDSDEYLVLSELYGLRSREGSWAPVSDRLSIVLQAIGDRWAQGTLTIAQEHSGTDRLRRALSRAIDTLPASFDKPDCLLCLPDGERHGFGLLFAELCAREAGWSTTALSGSLPTDELVKLVQHTQAQMIVLSASTCAEPALLADLLEKLQAPVRRRGVQLVLGGQGRWPEPPPVGLRMHQFTRFRSFLEQHPN
jgi:excisionase family DNA binding protein